MEMNWLQSLIFALISGLTEFLPVSTDAHTKLYTYFMGIESEIGLRFFVQLGCLAAVLVCCRPQLVRILRERRIAVIPKKRRKRVPDPRVMATYRLFITASIPVCLGFFGYRFLSWIPDRLWILALVLAFHGFVVYLPQRFRSANKEARAMSSLDALLIGLSGTVGGIPGCSRIGFMTAVGSVRGGDRRFILDLCLLICIPAQLIAVTITGFQFLALGSIVFPMLLRYLVSGILAFSGACGAILMIRFMAYKTGFSGFAYYNWGLALFTFIIYLIV